MFLCVISVIFLINVNDFVHSQVSIDDLCHLDANRIGTCLDLRQCPYAIELVKSRIKPKHCGFEGRIPIVCCQVEKSNLVKRKSSRIAEEKCLLYSSLHILPIPPVVGGENAYPLEFPHMAILGYGNEDDIRWRCAGSLISENFVLTAAHCIDTKEGTVKFVNLGEHQLRSMSSDNVVQKFKVKDVYLYPEHNPDSRYHDIALIELDKSANIYNGVKPACLPINKEIPNGDLIVTGWGASYYGGSNMEILQKATLDYVPYETCKKTYRPQIYLEGGLKDDWQICAFGRNTSADACQGDSGGPLQIKVEGQFLHTILGITSFGIKCGILPGIYTRVSYYVPWIESIVWQS